MIVIGNLNLSVQTLFYSVISKMNMKGINGVDILTKKSARQLHLTVFSGLSGDLGSSIFSFGLSFMLLDRTGSVFSFAISNIVSPIMGLFLLPLVGPLIDTVSKKRVILLSQLVTVIALIAYWIALPLLGSNLFLPSVLLIVILRGSDQFTSTARQASCARLVVDDHLQKLSAYSQMSNSAANIVSSVFGALLYALLPFDMFILFEIIAEMITAAITVSLNFNLNKEKIETSSDLERETESKKLVLFKEGLEYIRTQNFLLFGMVIAVMVNFVSGIFSVGLPILFLKVFDLSNLHFGFAESMNAAGFFLGGLFLHKLEIKYPLLNGWHSVTRIGLSLILIGISTFIGGTTGEIAVYILCFATGIFFITLNVPYVVWAQKNVPAVIQGRVFSVLGSLGLATAPLGVLFYGLIFNQEVKDIGLLTALTFLFSGIVMIILNFLLWKMSHLNLKEAKIFDIEGSD